MFLWSLSVLLLHIKKYILLVYLGFLLLCFCTFLKKVSAFMHLHIFIQNKLVQLWYLRR